MKKENNKRLEILFLMFFIIACLFVSLVYAESLIKCENGICVRIDGKNEVLKITEAQEVIKGVKVTNSEVSIVNNGKRVVIDIKKSGSIEVNGGKLNIDDEKIPKFVFDEKGKLTDGSHFIVGKDGGSFKLKGYELKLPEKADVLFEKGIVSISLPKASQVPDLKKIDEIEAKDAVFEFSSIEDNEKIKLPESLNSDLFKGILKFKNGQFYVSDEKAEINGFVIENKNKEDILLFGDGEEHKEAKVSYSSWKKGKAWIIGKNDKGAGPSYEVIPGNEFFKDFNEKQHLKFRAGKDKDSLGEAGAGVIAIKETNGNVEIETKEDFKIENGYRVIASATGKDGKKEIVELKKEEDKLKEQGKLSYPLKIKPYDKDGKVLIKRGEYELFIKIDGNNKIKAVKAGEVETDAGVETKPETGKKQPSRVEVNPEGEGSKKEEYFSSKLKTKVINVNIPQGSSALSIIEFLTKERVEGDILFKIHEETHFANSDRTTANGYFADYAPDSERYRAFIIGFDKNTDKPVEVLIKGTGIKKSDVKEYLPQSLWSATALEDASSGRLTSFYDTYLGGVHANKDAIHAFDDISAYKMEASYALTYTERTGRVLEQGSGNVGRTMASVMQPVLLGQELKDKYPEYWNGEAGTQFKAYLARSSETAMQIYNKANTDSNLRNYLGYSDKLLNSLRTQKDTSGMRKFLIETYGQEWTQRVFGF